MSLRLKVFTDRPQVSVTWPQNVDSIGPESRVGQGRLSQLRYFSHWADLKLPIHRGRLKAERQWRRPLQSLFRMNQLSSRQRGCRSRMSRAGRRNSMKGRCALGRKVLSLSLACRCDGALGGRRVKDGVGDPWRAPPSASQDPIAMPTSRILLASQVGMTGLTSVSKRRL